MNIATNIHPPLVSNLTLSVFRNVSLTFSNVTL